MASHRKVWRLLQRGLTGEAVANIVIKEIERLERGEAALWSDVEIERMKQPLTTESKARHAYARIINRWCQEHGLEMSLDEIDPPSEAGLETMVRFHVIDRYLAYTRGESDLPPVSPDVSEAWADFMDWCRDGPYHSLQPIMPEATFRHIFREQRPFHDWEMSAPRPEGTRPCRWCGEKCLAPTPRPNRPENTPADVP